MYLLLFLFFDITYSYPYHIFRNLHNKIWWPSVLIIKKSYNTIITETRCSCSSWCCLHKLGCKPWFSEKQQRSYVCSTVLKIIDRTGGACQICVCLLHIKHSLKCRRRKAYSNNKHCVKWSICVKFEGSWELSITLVAWKGYDELYTPMELCHPINPIHHIQEFLAYGELGFSASLPPLELTEKKPPASCRELETLY